MTTSFRVKFTKFEMGIWYMYAERWIYVWLLGSQEAFCHYLSLIDKMCAGLSPVGCHFSPPLTQRLDLVLDLKAIATEIYHSYRKPIVMVVLHAIRWCNEEYICKRCSITIRSHVILITSLENLEKLDNFFLTVAKALWPQLVGSIGIASLHRLYDG